MPIIYLYPGAEADRFQQGEIIAGLSEYRPVRLKNDGQVEVEFAVRQHSWVIVMTNDCDLLWDSEQRVGTQQDNPFVNRKVLPHVLLCEMYGEEEIRGVGNADLWKRIRQNQDERYHKLGSGKIGEPASGTLPELYLDFKKYWTIQTELLITPLQKTAPHRLAVVPPVHLHDLLHRFYSYLSRVAVPN